MPVTNVAVELTCSDLDQATQALLAIGFRIDRISPADDPSEADVSGHGTTLRVRQVAAHELLPVRLHLGLRGSTGPDARPWPANWTIVWQPADSKLELPVMVPELVVSRAADASLGVGRAGMLYRDLPTLVVDSERDFGGQRFVWHRNAKVGYEAWDHEGFEARNSGIDQATNGMADVRVARPSDQAPVSPTLLAHDHEFRFHFVLEGSTRLSIDDAEPIAGSSVGVLASDGERHDC